jgi:hypothetical protein
MSGQFGFVTQVGEFRHKLRPVDEVVSRSR